MNERSEWTGEKIRNVELPKAYLGGLDETSTRKLLADLAARIDESALERDGLMQRVKELEAALEEREPEAVPEGYTEQALSQLIRDARQRFEDLLHQANEEAASLKAAAAMEAEKLVDDARVELQKTQQSAEELHQLLVDTSDRLVRALETARSTVETLGAPFSAPTDDSLVEDLWPTEPATFETDESSQAPDEELEEAEVPSAVSAEMDSEHDTSR